MRFVFRLGAFLARLVLIVSLCLILVLRFEGSGCSPKSQKIATAIRFEGSGFSWEPRLHFSSVPQGRGLRGLDGLGFRGFSALRV